MTHLEAHDAAIDAAQAENRTYYVWEEGKGEWFYAPAGSPLIPSQARHDLERVLPSYPIV